MRTAAIYNFLTEANIMAGLAILLMIPVRKWLRKPLGNRAICFAWLLVAVRLLCPLALPNPMINGIVTPYNADQQAIRPIAGQVKVRMRDALNSAAYSAARSVRQETGVSFAEAMHSADYQRLSGMAASIETGRAAKQIFAVYLSGMGAAAAWMVFANVRFQRKMKRNRFGALEGETLERYRALCARYGVRPVPVYWTDPLSSACLVGVFRPYIALPLAADEKQAMQMLTHEICHLKGRDPAWTAVTLLCCVIHWFNPLVWLAAAMSRTDRELLCDDRVTRDMDGEEKRRYAGALIQAAAQRVAPGMPVLAVGMSMTGRKLKTRVAGILRGGTRMKAPAVAFALTASVLLVLAFGTAATATASLDGDALSESGQADAAAGSDDSFLDAAGLAALPPAQEGEYGPDRLIFSELQAAAYAKMLWTGPLLRWDLTGAVCRVYQNAAEDQVTSRVSLPSGREIDVITPRKTRGFSVQFWLENGHVLGVTFSADGRVEYLFNGDSDHYQAESAVPEGTEADREALEKKILEFAEILEPGVTALITQVQDLGDEILDGVHYANFRLSVQGQDDHFVCVILPDLTVVEYGTGNG